MTRSLALSLLLAAAGCSSSTVVPPAENAGGGQAGEVGGEGQDASADAASGGSAGQIRQDAGGCCYRVSVSTVYSGSCSGTPPSSSSNCRCPNPCDFAGPYKETITESTDAGICSTTTYDYVAASSC